MLASCDGSEAMLPEAVEQQRLHDEALAGQRPGISRVSGLLSWLARNHGPDALEGALCKMNSSMLGRAGFRERAR